MHLSRLAFGVLVLAAAPAAAKRNAIPDFAEPGDIIAAESNFTHLSAAKGVKAAILATAAPNAQIFAPQLLRVTDYARTPDATAQWHTRQVWMSCDGSVAVSHGEWQRPPALGWYVTVWQRQNGGAYKWVLEEGGTLQAPLPESDMISAVVADCPPRRLHPASVAPPAPDRDKAPALDYRSGQADDATLAWTTTLDGGRSFALQVKQDGTMREVLRVAAAPAG